jgi:hypothetical protein
MIRRRAPAYWVISSEDEMDTSANALVFFYGVFWATSLARTDRYEAFKTAALFQKGARVRVTLRLAVALLVLTILPTGLVLALYIWVVPHDCRPESIASAALSSISVFGFIRLFHALVASDLTFRLFYTSAEIKEVRKHLGEQPQTFKAHFWPGVAYLVVFSLLGLGVGKISITMACSADKPVCTSSVWSIRP